MGTAVATLLRPFGLFRAGPKRASAVRKKARPQARPQVKPQVRAPEKVALRKKAKAKTGVGFMVRLKSAGAYSGMAAAILAASLILVAGYQFLLVGPVLGLERITIKGLDKVTSSQVLSLARLKQGVSLLQLDTGAIQRRLESSPWVESATVRRVLPDELSIAILERTPVGVIVHQGRRWYVDGSGKLFKFLKSEEDRNLPLINSNLGSSAGRAGWQPFVKAGQVIRALKNGDYSLGLGRVGSLSLDKHKGLIIHPAQKGPSLIMGRAEPGLGFAKLALVKADLKARGLWDRARYIDLRFEERVYVGFKAGKG